MTPNSTANRIWLLVLVVLLSIVGGSVYLVNELESQDVAKATVANQRELRLLAALVMNELRTGDYQHANEVLMEWGKANPDVVSLSLVAENEFRISDYRRFGPVIRSQSLDLEIAYSYTGRASLTLTKDLDTIEVHKRELVIQLGTAIVLIALLLSALTRLMLKSRFDADLQRQHAEALERERARAQLYLETVETIIIALDSTGRIKLINRKGCQVLGYSQEELLGKSWFATCLPQPKGLEAEYPYFLELLSGRAEPVEYYENEIATRSGEFRTIAWHNSLIYDEGGAIAGTMSAGEDITERKHAEEEVRKHRDHLEELVAERTTELAVAKESAETASKTKSDFLARMSHEIRTPLNAVIGLTNVVLKTELNSTQKDYLIKVDEASRHLLQIINDILDFSKIEAGKFELECEDFMLHHVINRMASMFRIKAAEKEVELFYVISRDVPLALKGDSLRLGQILINLIANAVKFTERGEVIVRAALDSDAPVSTPGRVNLIFSVQDSGIGIQPDTLETLFQPFTQTDGSVTRKYGGTGLGLSICQRLVTMMGGRIWGESEMGKGTTFHFTLALECSNEELFHVLHSPADISGMKTLVVDDNEISRHILEEILRSFDLQVTLAASGAEALAELEQAAAEKPYALMVVDWKMPGMDGFELAQRVREHSRLGDSAISPQIIMVTMYGREEFSQEQKRYKNNINGYLLKPINSSELFNAIMKVFGRQEAMVPRMDVEPDDTGLVDTSRIRGARLLLVEDNPINRKVASIILERAGFRVEMAENGQEAIHLIKATAKPNTPFFDAVLMDIEMPVMDGYAASRIIHSDSRFSDLPIIAMTAHALKGDREKCLAAGMSDYITKPIDEQLLFASLVKWIKTDNSAPAKREPPPLLPDDKPWDDMPTQIPGIDLTAGLDRIRGNTGLYKILLQNFISHFDRTDDQVATFLTQGAYTAARKQVHALKGVAGNLGANDLAKTAQEFEYILADEQKQNFKVPHENFAAQLSVVITALNDLFPVSPIDEDFSDDLANADIQQARSVMRDMRALLEQNNSRVRHALPALKKALPTSSCRELLKRLERTIYALDSEKALSILTDLSDLLDSFPKEETDELKL